MAAKTDNPKLPLAKECLGALEKCTTKSHVAAWTKKYMATLGYKAVGRILIGESPAQAIASKGERRELATK
ncbi:hypothetical protein LCGC14_1511130 [marine sediment metagenome]|uniref:Uncharacterized protein n=1 Tax=marine sediment metagenome TaxID=412755 RepID=A0A0F9JM37_9ZZZZ